MNIPPIKNIRFSARLRALSAVVMLVMYVSGTILADLIHQAVHHHQQASVVHTAQGCQHQAHLTKTEKCLFGHVVFHAHQYLEVCGLWSFIPSTWRSFPVNQFSAYHSSRLGAQLRGPPGRG